MTNPLVTVLCVTFNHEKFIRDALESFSNQRVNFQFEVIIGDDCSTDNTVEIVSEFTGKYDNFILVRQPVNVGPAKNLYTIANMVRSKYVALCDGDDYWIDMNKLQKQIDFMESNPDVTVCFHPTVVLDSDGEKSIYPENYYDWSYDLLRKFNFIQTNSVIYRWKFQEFKSHIKDKNMLPLDYVYHLFHAQKGKIAMLPEAMSVYRKNSGGVWSKCKSLSWYRNNGYLYNEFLNFVEQEFHMNQNDEKEINHCAMIFIAQNKNITVFMVELMLFSCLFCKCLTKFTSGDCRQKIKLKYRIFSLYYQLAKELIKENKKNK